jgi:hypothetical protein
MKVLIAIPVMGSYEIGRISLYQWDRTASPAAHFLLIDNSSHPTQYEQLFERKFLDLKRWDYVRNPENIGLIASCQQAYNFALGMEADILVLTHNDVWVYPPFSMETDAYEQEMGIMASPWDESVANLFSQDAYCVAGIERGDREYAKLGVVGLFGSKGCGREGHRLDTFGSLIEMAGHGRQMTEWIEPAVCLDGFFLACAMPMLKKAVYVCPGCDGHGSVDRNENRPCATCKGSGKQLGGFDQRYAWHHVYDYDIALTSIELGYRNAVLNIPCHHLSGLTANNAAYATSGQDVHQANYQRWLTKWCSKLGLTVDAAWNYKWEGK